MCFRQHLHPISPFALTSRHRHLFAGLFGCNRLRALCCLSFVNIYIHSSLFVSVPVRVFCVRGPCPCTSLLIRTRVSVSFSFPFLSSALRFKTPVVPPRFSTQAYNYATTFLWKSTCMCHPRQDHDGLGPRSLGISGKETSIILSGSVTKLFY